MYSHAFQKRKKLLFRPPKYPDECIVGYLARLSEGNGFAHLGHLLRTAGLHWKNNRAPIHSILTGEFRIDELLDCIGLPIVESKLSNVCQSFQPVVDTNQILAKSPRVCPDCLKEFNYVRYEWALLPYIACTKHKRLLIDSNPVTGKSLTWYRKNLMRYSDTNSTIEPIEMPIKKSLLQQSNFFKSLLCGNTGNKSSLTILAGLDLREALSLVHFIAHYQQRLLGFSFNSKSKKNLDLGQVYDQTWLILKNWPDSFYALLSQYVSNPMSSKGMSGINKHFRDLYENLHKKKDNLGVARIKSEFDTYVNEYWPGVLPEGQLIRIKQFGNIRNIISKKEVSNILSSRLERIDSLVLQGRLTPIVFKGKAHYNRDQVIELGKEFSANWSMSEACKAMELTRYQMKQLLDSEIIPVLQKPNNLNRDWVVDKAKCIALLDKLRKSSREPKPSTRTKSMSGIQKQGYSIVQLVLAMQNGGVEYAILPEYSPPLSFKQFTSFRTI